MKRLTIKILLLTAPLLLFLVWAEINLRSFKTAFENKQEEFERKLPGIDLLVFGNSHGENGINPTLLSDSGYNLSLPAQSLYYDAKILRKYIDVLKGLKTVIITVDYHSYYFIDQELSAFNNDKYFGVSKPGYDYRLSSENLSYFFFVYGALPSIGYLNRKPVQRLKINGYEPLPTADTNAINPATGFIRAATHNNMALKHATLKADLERSLIDMIVLLKERNIRTILVSMPVYHTYYNNLDKEVLQRNSTTTDSIATLFNVPYYNCMNMPSFQLEDFSDNDHLSANGARKFSMFLAYKVLKTAP